MNNKSDVRRSLIFVLIGVIELIIFNIFNIFNIDRRYKIKISYVIFVISIIVNIIYDIKNKNFSKFELVLSMAGILLCISMLLE